MGFLKEMAKNIVPLSWQKKWYKFKHPEVLDEVEIVFDLLKNESQPRLMLDVGAHVGSALEPFVRRGWKVYAFEPDPANRAKLEAFVGKFPNVKVVPIALSDQADGELNFYSSKVSSGISSLLNFHESHEVAAVVKVTNLKTYCEANGIKAVSFLKTDIEGYDLPVLRGNDWAAVQPRAIVCEFDDYKTKHLGYTLQEQADLLLRNGYKIIVSEWYPIEEYGRTHRWRRFTTNPAKVVGERVWGNIIAVKAADWEALCGLLKKHGPIEF